MLAYIQIMGTQIQDNEPEFLQQDYRPDCKYEKLNRKTINSLSFIWSFTSEVKLIRFFSEKSLGPTAKRSSSISNRSE